MADDEIKKPGESGVTDPYESFEYLDIECLVNNKDIKGLIDVVQHAQKRFLVKLALFALDRVGDKTAIPALLDYALYGQHGLAWRDAAVRALGHIGKHEVVELLIYIMGNSKGTSVCVAAIRALGEIKDERALKPLTFVMNDPNEENYAREEAVKALGLMATKESLTSVIGVLDSGLADTASAVLKEVGEPAIELLISALVNANQAIREKAVTILGEMVLDTKATESLISIMKRDIEDASVIKSVVMVLGQLGDKRATGPLLKAFEKHLLSNFDLTEEIIKALGKIKDSSAVKPLLTALKPHSLHTDDDYRVQIFLIFALGEIGDKKATEPLLKLLLDKTNELRIRLTAAWALGLICDEEAIEPLVAVLSDNRDDDTVRGQILSTLFRYPGGTAAGPMLVYIKAHPDLVSQAGPVRYSDNDETS